MVAACKGFFDYACACALRKHIAGTEDDRVEARKYLMTILGGGEFGGASATKEGGEAAGFGAGAGVVATGAAGGGFWSRGWGRH